MIFITKANKRHQSKKQIVNALLIATGDGQTGHKVRAFAKHCDEVEIPVSSYGRRGCERAQRWRSAIVDARNG